MLEMQKMIAAALNHNQSFSLVESSKGRPGGKENWEREEKGRKVKKSKAGEAGTVIMHATLYLNTHSKSLSTPWTDEGINDI